MIKEFIDTKLKEFGVQKYEESQRIKRGLSDYKLIKVMYF